MITEEIARKMMKNLYDLKRKFDKSKSENDKKKYFDYETICLKELSYFIDMKSRKYNKFSNHSDLSQDAYEALLKAIRTFKLSDEEGKDKGSFFYWIGLFVNTKLARSANNHTAVRYPMHVAKLVSPRKENRFPMLTDSGNSPEKTCEQSEINEKVQVALKVLSDEQREFVNLAYGFNGDGPMSISKICEKKEIARSACTKIIDSALDLLKNEIKI